jgi:hypothetical protein
MTDATRPYSLRQRPFGLVLLVVLLVAASWPAFKLFIIGTIVVGLAAAAVLRQWNSRHPSTRPAQSRSRAPEINFSSMPVAGDAAGLLFAIGSVVIVVVGMPGITWYLIGSLACGVLFAAALSTARAMQRRQPMRQTTLGLR